MKTMKWRESLNRFFYNYSMTQFAAKIIRTNMENGCVDNGISEPVRVKKKKPGIVYLGALPPYMNVTKVKDIFSQYGNLGRIFLQPDEKRTGKPNKKKPPLHFSEGWIEFESKRIAKMVAQMLNNTQIGGKKSSKFYDYMWNIKYLSGFKWVHLNERLAYEKAVRKHRLRAEIAQAKKEANFFTESLEKSKKLKKSKGQKAYINKYKQKQTESEIQESKINNQDRKEFLKSLFSKS